MLKLKPGQKFIYDPINSSKGKAKKHCSNTYEYSKTNFEVISHNCGIYTVKATPEIFLTIWSPHLQDATLPFEQQPAEFMPIAKKVMTDCSYQLKMDENGNITGIDGIPEIRAAIRTKLLLLPNGVYATISFFSNYGDILSKYLKWEI